MLRNSVNVILADFNLPKKSRNSKTDIWSTDSWTLHSDQGIF